MAMIKCSECGKEISDKATSCIHCGCPVEKKITCSECGKELNNMDICCPNCGYPVNTKVNHNNFKNDILKLFNINNKVIIIGGIILFILLLIIIYNITQSKPNIIGTWEHSGYTYGVYYRYKYTFKNNGTATREYVISGYGNNNEGTTKCRYKFRNKNAEIKIIQEGSEDEAEWVNFSMDGDTIYIDNEAYKRK